MSPRGRDIQSLPIPQLPPIVHPIIDLLQISEPKFPSYQGFPPYVWQVHLFGLVVPLHTRGVSPLVYHIALRPILVSGKPGKSLTHSLPYFSYSFLLFHWQLLTQGLTLTNSFSLLLTPWLLLLTSYFLTSPYWLTSYSLLLTPTPSWLTPYSLLLTSTPYSYFSLLLAPPPYFSDSHLFISYSQSTLGYISPYRLQKSRKSKTISERVQQLKPICIPMYIKEIDPQHP